MTSFNWSKARTKPEALECTLNRAHSLKPNPEDHLTYSKAHKAYIPPSKGRRINPDSKEGRAITAKYLVTEMRQKT